MREDDETLDQPNTPETPDRPEAGEVALATPVDDDQTDLVGDEDEAIGSGGNGRFVTAIAAAILLIGLFLTWYEVVRRSGFTEHTTGWQTFTRMRFVLLAGAAACLASVLAVQTRLIVLGRIAVGVIASALVIRRVVSPPDLPGSTVTAQLGIYIALLGAIGVAFGGLLGLGSADDDEDDLAPEGEVPVDRHLEAPDPDDHDEVVEAEVVDEPAAKEPAESQRP